MSDSESTTPSSAAQQLAELNGYFNTVRTAKASAAGQTEFLDAASIAGYRDNGAQSASASGKNLDMFSSTMAAQPHNELRAVREYRESWAMASRRKRVSKVIAAHPRTSGPLNSLRLTVESLDIMAQLSPRYLNRFVSYVDTLLWLEHSDQIFETAKKDDQDQ